MKASNKQKEYQRKRNVERQQAELKILADNIKVDRYFLKKILSELTRPSEYTEILKQQLILLINNDESKIKLLNSRLN